MVVIMTSQTPIVDIPEVTDQQREWQVTLHLYVIKQCVQVWGKQLHMLPFYLVVGELQGDG